MFQNSIGNISPPHYFYWEIMYLNGKKTRAKVLIIIVWLTWTFQIYVQVIVMLNFIIAVVNDSYVDSKETQKKNTLLLRANYNLEFMETMHFFDNFMKVPCLTRLFGYESKNFNFLLIVSEREELDLQAEQNREVIK